MMSLPSAQPEEKKSREDAHWAHPVSRLKVGDVPTGAINLNVEGRQVVGPLQGFGQLWQKTYQVGLRNVKVTPQEVVKFWKEKLPNLMPTNSRFTTSPGLTTLLRGGK